MEQETALRRDLPQEMRYHLLSLLALTDTADGGVRVSDKGVLGLKIAEEPCSVQQARLASAKRILASRRLRTRFFDSELFGEPAWDLLLDLYVADRLKRLVSISSACIAAAVPATTALRWIQQLTARGMLERTDDPADARRVYISLSEQALAAIEAYLDANEPAAGLSSR